MPRPRSVLHVLTTISRGGAENHVADLIAHQRRSGMEVSVAYLRREGYWTEAYQAMGVRVHALRMLQYGDPLALMRLRRAIRTERPEIIHAHMQPAELYTRLALLISGDAAGTFVITKHVDRPFYHGPFNRPVGRWVARRATRVIAISGSLRRYLVEGGLRLPAGQVTQVNYSLDPRPFLNVDGSTVARLRKEWGAGPDTTLFGVAARFVSQKSLDTLIDGFAILCRSHPAVDARLVMVGCGPLETPLREQATRLGISDRITWPGFRHDIPVVMSALDVFCLSSVNEGFGLVLLEAMAAGRPVVGTRVSSLPEIVVDGETGFLVPPRQAEAFANAMARLLDPKLRDQMGRAGRERVAREFVPQRMFEATDRVYAEVCAGHPEPA